MKPYHYCPECLLPNTHPNTKFDEDGICLACKNYKKRKEIDWKRREEELRIICDSYRTKNNFSCVIAVSGGKDSTFITKILVEDMKMNPLLITVADPFTKTQAGIHNLNNLKERFNCDTLVYEIGRKTFRKATRHAFEKLGEPLKYIEYAIYTIPYKIAEHMGIKLVFFGENSAYEYGYTDNQQLYNEHIIDNLLENVDVDFWKEVLDDTEMYPINKMYETHWSKLLFMSYFYPWSSVKHYEIAKKYGFKDLCGEWDDRKGTFENFEQIDSVSYSIHLWMKFCKLFFARTTDIVSRRIREGYMTIEEGKKLILEHDHLLDNKSLEDFINFCGYTKNEFYTIVGKFWDRDIFERDQNEQWKPKINRF